MTHEEARKEQEYMSGTGWKLQWWYGTGCEPCEGVYPKFVTEEKNGGGCYFECPACGKRTAAHSMTWQAVEAWNAGEFLDMQGRLFE